MTNLILTRDLDAPPPPAAIEAARALATRCITDTGDANFGALDRLYAASGFPAGWSAGLLGRGARAFLLFAPGGEAAAGGWLLHQPFYIDEIHRSFHPDPDADYYFGDLVIPTHRGKRLQTALIRERIAHSRATGRHWAVAMTRSDNIPSFINYSSTGFTEAGGITTRFLRFFQVDRIRPSRSELHGVLSGEGIPIGRGYRLRRAHR